MTEGPDTYLDEKPLLKYQNLEQTEFYRASAGFTTQKALMAMKNKTCMTSNMQKPWNC